MQLSIAQRIRIMWPRDVIASDAVTAAGETANSPTANTLSGMFIPAGTVYDGLVTAVAADGTFDMVLANGQALTLNSTNPVIAVAVLSQFAPYQE